MKKIYQYILMAVAMIATASCSNDMEEALLPADNGNLQFVVSNFPAFGEGAQTRAIGLQDEGKTSWENDDVIFVHLYSSKYGNQAATLTFKAEDATWISSGTLSYLENENPTITAVYAPGYEISTSNEIVLKDDHEYGMAEYIRANTNIADNTLQIEFEPGRAYSRLRIAATADEKVTVTTNDFTPAGPNGATVPASYTLTADENGNAYLYGTFAANATVKVVGEVTVEHTFTEATLPGISYALFARLGANLSDMTSTFVIVDDATYFFYGSGRYGIKVESGSPTVILGDANINVSSGNAIDITADNSGTTIHVQGTNNVTSGNGAGIYVAEGSTVTITGNTRNDKLTVKAGRDAAAIGGYATGVNSYQNCGAININNITVEAYGGSYSTCSPGIGSVGTASCQTITIDNACVDAFGTTFGLSKATPGIGCGWPITGGPQSIPTIIINNSLIYTCRGNTSTDYIGWADERNSNNTCNFGTNGSATNSYIYCYTGDVANVPDKAFFYDANGTATE